MDKTSDVETSAWPLGNRGRLIKNNNNFAKMVQGTEYDVSLRTKQGCTELCIICPAQTADSVSSGASGDSGDQRTIDLCP